MLSFLCFPQLEMETGWVDRHRSDRTAGRVTRRVEIQASQKTGQIFLSCD